MPPRSAADHDILSALAFALVEQPGASLQLLAQSAGISRATLYRFCRTREELIERLTTHSLEATGEAVRAADLANAPPLEALRRLIARSLEHPELTAFLTSYWKDVPPELKDGTWWDAELDAFFLRGQQQGVFRIDIGAAALTEIWFSVLVGLMDAERRGRVARSGLAALIESVFLQGTRAISS